MISSTELSTKLREKEVVLRNPDDHILQVQEVESLGNEASKKYGINRHSVLDELQYFKVASGALVSDILHDVLEGALQYEVKLMLKKFMQDDRYFTIDQINQKIDAFDFGYLESKNRPTPLSLSSITNNDDHSLKQSGKCCIELLWSIHYSHFLFIASQMWCFGRFLPLIIGEWIPEENENWVEFLLLLDIVDILFSPELNPEDIAKLTLLIEEHHREFKALYPLSSFLPKMHYLLHMPRLIKL